MVNKFDQLVRMLEQRIARQEIALNDSRAQLEAAKESRVAEEAKEVERNKARK